MKKITVIFSILVSLALPMQAQVFSMEDEKNDREINDFGIIPQQWVDYDQGNAIAPLGEGLVLLAALGGAYLIGKKHKKETSKR